MDLPVLYAKKALVLRRIVSNYRLEKQAMAEKNSRTFKQALDERALLIDELSKLNEEEGELEPVTPLEVLQKNNIQRLVEKIAEMRQNGNPFFPQ